MATQHPENIFQAARVPPPTSKQTPIKSTYVRAGQDYPSWRYHEQHGSKLVQNEAEDLAALETGWGAAPFEAPLPDAPAPSGRENLAAWQKMVDRLTVENEKLTEENMRLRSQVEDSKDVASIAELREKLEISERARKGLQVAADASELAKARMRAEKMKQTAPAVVAEEPEGGDDLMQLIRQHGGQAEPPPEE